MSHLAHQVQGVGSPIETQASYVEQKPIFVDHRIPKLYFALRRRNRLGYWFSVLFFLAAAGFCSLSICHFYSATNVASIDWLPKIWKSITQEYLKHTITGAFAFYLFIHLIYLIKKRYFLKQLKREIRGYKKIGSFPTNVTVLLNKYVTRIYFARCHAFWAFFLFCCLSVIGMIYSMIAAGIVKIIKGSTEQGGIFKLETYTKFFTKLKMPETSNEQAAFCFFICAFVLASSIVFIILSKMLCWYKVRKFCKIFNYDEVTGNNELRERLHRRNKKLKIVVLILTCLIGLIIYIVFKKLVISVFDKSFANKG